MYYGLQSLYGALYGALGGPSWEETKDLYGTYDEGYKDPEMYKDVGRFSANTLKDVAQFFPDILTDVVQSGISQLAQTELYNPFSKEGMKREIARKKSSYLPNIPGVDFMGPIDMLEPEWKYSMDANLTDWLGEKLGMDVPTLMKDNPFENAILDEEGRVVTYHNPSFRKIEKQADKELDDYYFGKNGIITEKRIKEIDKMTTRALPVAKWAEENYNTDPKEYDKAWNKEWDNQFDNRYSDEMYDFTEKSIKGQLLGKYNIGGKKFSPLGEFEASFDYASAGKPLFKYDPKRAKTFEKAHRISELPAGVGLFRAPFKIASRMFKKSKPSRMSNEGIMNTRTRIEDKDKYRYAEDWMNRQAGQPPFGSRR